MSVAASALLVEPASAAPRRQTAIGVATMAAAALLAPVARWADGVSAPAGPAKPVWPVWLNLPAWLEAPAAAVRRAWAPSAALTREQARLVERALRIDWLTDEQRAAVHGLLHAMEAKDPATAGHARRVQTLALELAVRLGMSDEADLRALSLAALLHDVGKLDIPESILQKPGALNAAETAIMQSHANRGATRLTTLGLPGAVTTIVRHHHEHWDGSGYPWGLKETGIPFGARIVAVADCFDALTSDRPYRGSISSAAANAQLGDRMGAIHDPTLVRRTRLFLS